MIRFRIVALDSVEILLAAFWPRYYRRLMSRMMLRRLILIERRIRIDFVLRAAVEGHLRLD